MSNWLRNLRFAVAKQRRYRLLTASQLFGALVRDTEVVEMDELFLEASRQSYELMASEEVLL